MARTLIYDTLGSLELIIRKDESNPATVTVRYAVRTASGQEISDVFSPVLTAAQLITLRDFVTNTVIPQIRSREGI